MTTTVEITDDQREFLREVSEVSAKRALQALIDDYNNGGGGEEALSEERVRELAREEITDRVVMEALE